MSARSRMALSAIVFGIRFAIVLRSHSLAACFSSKKLSATPCVKVRAQTDSTACKLIYIECVFAFDVTKKFRRHCFDGGLLMSLSVNHSAIQSTQNAQHSYEKHCWLILFAVFWEKKHKLFHSKQRKLTHTIRTIRNGTAPNGSERIFPTDNKIWLATIMQLYRRMTTECLSICQEIPLIWI